jgi:hypothetical protein
MPWSDWVPTPEAHARASGRRGYNKRRQKAVQVRRVQVARLLERWGTSVAVRAEIADLMGCSVDTIRRDMHALKERPPLPVICPTCGLPSRLDVDPATVTDDPVELARLERAMVRLIGADKNQAHAPKPRWIAASWPKPNKPVTRSHKHS